MNRGATRTENKECQVGSFEGIRVRSNVSSWRCSDTVCGPFRRQFQVS